MKNDFYSVSQLSVSTHRLKMYFFLLLHVFKQVPISICTQRIYSVIQNSETGTKYIQHLLIAAGATGRHTPCLRFLLSSTNALCTIVSSPPIFMLLPIFIDRSTFYIDRPTHHL